MNIRHLLLHIGWFLGVALSVACRGLPAQDASGWKLERLVLKDGSNVQGLLIAEHRTTIEFVEIQRPRGKPIQAVVKPFPHDRVQRIERLPAPEREQLQERFLALRNRTRIEADRMEALKLDPVAPAAPGAGSTGIGPNQPKLQGLLAR